LLAAIASLALVFGLASPAQADTQAPGTYKGLGFDTCQAPSQATMDAWRKKSPFRAIGIYISGNSRFCGDAYQSNLTKSWVEKNTKNGWRFLPLHVGYQSPCFKNNPNSRVQKKKMSSKLSKAREQASSDAKETIGRLRKFGFSTGSVSYLDLEWYKRTSSCDAAVLAFISTWTDTLHKAKYRSGVYSSGSAAINLIDDSIASGKKFSRPDHIWNAWTNKEADTDFGPYMSSKRYTDHQRIHQYKNGDSVEYGGHRLTIDWDYLDVKAASTGGSSPVPANETRSERVARLAKGSTPTLKPRAKGSAVTRVQRALYATGRKVPVTGYYGYLTVRAVKSYRKANGLRVIPAVTDQMWEALQHGKIK
jgi:hypothetical protein